MEMFRIGTTLYELLHVFIHGCSESCHYRVIVFLTLFVSAMSSLTPPQPNLSLGTCCLLPLLCLVPASDLPQSHALCKRSLSAGVVLNPLPPFLIAYSSVIGRILPGRRPELVSLCEHVLADSIFDPRQHDTIVNPHLLLLCRLARVLLGGRLCGVGSLRC